MAPNSETLTTTLIQGETLRNNVASKKTSNGKADVTKGKEKHKLEIIWKNIFKFGLGHLLALNGLMLIHTISFKTVIFSFILWLVAKVAITAGAHRLWTHRSYKASLPLRVILMLGNCIAMENSIFHWTRDHRVHHKFSETSADPHDASRGFFFAHMGWLLVRKNPDVLREGNKIDMSDLRADPVVMFQHRHYWKLSLPICIVLPTLIPWYFWGEALWTSYVVQVLRYAISLHSTWLVNSAAHMWGDRPYDEHVNPAENRLVSLLAGGEGFHNYHHTFPHDYSASEWRWGLNVTTFFIDSMAWCGLAWGRRSVSREAVEARKIRTGPGSSAPKEREKKTY